ncbi:MAG: carbon monoxide dehydrogenase beta subunit family protein, partial [Candidatus Bathyarchaeia archaeon]
LSKIGNVTVAATGHLVAEFIRRGAENVHPIPLMNLGDRLRDADWGGFDGGGAYDLVLFVGFAYHLEWLVLSGLKSFATNLRTISLDNTYQPNASWSLGSMNGGDWREVLDRIASILEEGS